MQCEASPLTLLLPGGTLAPYGGGSKSVISTFRHSRAPGKSRNVNHVSVSGGGAPSVALDPARHGLAGTSPVRPAGQRAGFEDESGALWVRTRARAPIPSSSRAPSSSTRSSRKASKTACCPLRPLFRRTSPCKSPTGFLGNPPPLPQCTLGQFLTKVSAMEIGERLSGADRDRGRDGADQRTGLLGPWSRFTVPIFNLEPGFGEPARFGFYVTDHRDPDPPRRRRARRTRAPVKNTRSRSVPTTPPSSRACSKAELTFWGVPGDPRHDGSRGWAVSWQEAARRRARPPPSTRPRS